MAHQTFAGASFNRLYPAAGRWMKDRTEKHCRSGKLYLHGIITGLVAWILTGWQYLLVALIILITHTLVNGWKSC